MDSKGIVRRHERIPISSEFFWTAESDAALPMGVEPTGLRIGISEAGVKAVYADNHLSLLVNISGEDRQLGVDVSILIRHVDTLYCFFYLVTLDRMSIVNQAT